MNGRNGFWNGGAANNPRFFGTSTSELVARPADLGGWNGDYSVSASSAQPWLSLGGQANQGNDGVGVFGYQDDSGGVATALSHRTILSGY